MYATTKLGEILSRTLATKEESMGAGLQFEQGESHWQTFQQP